MLVNPNPPIQPKINQSLTITKQQERERERESNSKSNLPWILGGVGVVSLTTGVVWYFTKKGRK